MVWKEGGAVVGEKSSSSRGTYMVVLDGSFEQEKKSIVRTKYGVR